MTAFWRMQLHPDHPEESMRYCVQSLAAGFIGLDFGKDAGDLRRAKRDDLPSGQRDYIDFATKMKKGDQVLIVAHNWPFALASVAGPYNYIARREGDLGIWFRHFRKVTDVRYYSDYRKNARKWFQVIMPDALSILGKKTQTYQFMKQWASDV